MLKNSDDRRARRSRKLLKQGLLELMQRKKFGDISIREITERMDLNRGTFYLHYPDTAALLQSLEDDLESEAQALIDAHIQESLETGTLRPVFEPILDFLVTQREACTVLFDNNDVSGFTGRLQKLCQRNGTEIVRLRFHLEDERRLAYLLNFVTYGLIGLMKEWFDQGMVLPKEELIAMADGMLNGAIGSMPAAGPARRKEDAHVS